MKKLILVLGILSVLPVRGTGQAGSYQAGEKVTYLVHYGVVTGGIASLELKKEILDGKELWHSIMVGRTTGLADAVFKVYDIYESYIDPKTELPVLSVRNISEGRYRRYNEVTFDHKTRKDSAILASDLTGIHIAPQGIHDIVSCFYWYRNQIFPGIDKINKGEMITVMTWFTDELYPIKMKYLGTEEVKTKAGKIKCHKFNPVTEKGRLFKTEDDVSFWFSDDKNFLPVKIRFDIFVGSFMVDMQDYEGLLYPLDIKKK
ncbi:MAG: hypothetical protein A2V64_07750 [Bacteroidetes bacterium RBG_13_43_22]|nr:MAG: hypothetical protein A2V64_07750 [Bacteroidetes bacterium RBG_13_43_22]